MNAADPASREEASSQTRGVLARPRHWPLVVLATPGALVATIGYVFSQGWAVWVSFIVSMLIAAALLHPLFEISWTTLVVLPVAAAGVAWVLSLTMRWLAAVGWESQFVVYATTAGVTISRLVDVLHSAHQLERFTRWGKKAVRSRQT